jgi:peptidoglycan/xylan/chitin deacetylase (PgdA/CDA1 family)
VTCVAITVDVDGEAGLPDAGRAYGDRLSSRSEREYGVTRGLPRVLNALEAFGAPATFYVPGVTALRHPEAVRGLVSLGPEVGHHGHTHARPDRLSEADQRAEIEHGLAALSSLGVRPRGYRAPGWELTPVTLGLLAEQGFHHDSSLMGDDRPYVVRTGTGSLVELPVHWSLDDAPYFATPADPSGVWHVWRRELELAAQEDRAITLTLHPEILGRPHRLDVLRHALDLIRELGLRPVTHAELAAAVTPPRPATPQR